MKRMHVHVSVADLAESIRFYSGMFASPPTVVKPDYAKWALDDPRVNFAMSQRGAPVGVNHLGIQVESAEELGEMHGRLQTLQTLQHDVKTEEGVDCCYAKSDKYWVSDPAGIAWETFHTLDTIPVFGAATTDPATGEACCMPAPDAKKEGACCASASKCC